MGKFHQIFTELSAHDMIMAGCYSLTFLFFLVILHFLLIQEGQLSVTGKSKRTKYWLPIQRTKYMPRKSGGRLTDWLDITLLVLTGP